MHLRHAACCTVLGLLTGWSTAGAEAAPQIRNGSFEADAYSVSPGYARQNGGAIAEWRATGSSGVNPIWSNAAKRTGPEAPFWDNGRLPHGRQLAFIQGPGALRQTVTGFKRGSRYRVVYRENARVQRRGDQWPQARVTLGGQEIVSTHEVTPVTTADQMDAPFYRVESAWFTAAADAASELVIEAVQSSGTTTLLLDDIRLETAPGE